MSDMAKIGAAVTVGAALGAAVKSVWGLARVEAISSKGSKNEKPAFTLFVYDHCPFCSRARVILGLKGVPHELAFMANHDEVTPMELVGAKQAPIIQLPSGKSFTESMDIVKYVDENYGGPSILAPPSGREDIKKWIEESAHVFHILYHPRVHKAPFAEFAQQESRDYFRVKKEKSMGPFEEALKRSPQLVEEVNVFLEKLATMFYSDHSVNKTLGYDDIDLFGRLRCLTLVRGIKWPSNVREFLNYMSETGDVSLLDNMVILATSALAMINDACSGPNARTEPPAGAIVVDATGVYEGSFETVSEGVENLNRKTTKEQTIFVMPGVYHEQVHILPMVGPLVLQGYTCDAMSYEDNEVTITQAKAQKDIAAEVTRGRNDLTSTVRFKSDNVKVYNLNIANTAGNVGQAVAVNVGGTDYGFYACNFTGYQDTLLANKGRELFARSYISGAVDFIFGAYATAWFESCDIEVVGKGCITANGRDTESNPSWFVFNNAVVFGDTAAGSNYLGRPWRPYSRVIWQNSKLGDVINPKGWSTWDATSGTDNVYYGEFNNTGPGAIPDKRVDFSGQRKKALGIDRILGEDYDTEWWVDTDYL
ncbi:hypothetical protein BBO99_00009677 [Phytophthora kernoviae]|uniref:Pectinesterase n=2 Tax=Phytophthora kernoviae TaxID=325452 RepID=A0A421GC60_9STRA|nr:hypothetical protein G195_011466 [Phytophthora kernoviae 00238/432]KAG2502918.1 hypothetical protein JM16_009427 [Phytophthora kernoviae]KAG2503544.1 hypothetical protein JM18_009633 [Phytophthora kernoviae]RLN20639.1 hypothetical protein BBI17_009718 [Phytophthora kernoviae]RLN72815.1 hypothetical protein BBO99_00009677 [Phytophthora kernoviae]